MIFGSRRKQEPQLESLLAEIEALARIEADGRDPDVDRRIMRLRFEAGTRLVKEASPDASYPSPAPGVPRSDAGLPEITPDDVSPELLRAAILEHGCLLIRGLLDREEAASLAEGIDRAFAAREAQTNGATRDGYYEEFEVEPESPFRAGLMARQFVSDSGVWAADSPRVMFEMLGAFERAGLQRLASGYLGERPAISVNKCTLRRIPPDVMGDAPTASAWHQDGAFLGDDIRALNVWLSLSRCGDLAPGLDLVPRRLDHIVPTGTEGATFDWSVSQAVAEESAGDVPIVRPIFEPGDVLLFDEMFLHATAAEPDMPNTRYAIESWFFGPSAFPPEYAPLAF